MSELWSWIKNHKAISIAVGFGIGLLIYLFIKSRQTANAGATAGTPGQTGPGEQYYIALLQTEDESTRPIHVGPIGPAPGPPREPPQPNPQPQPPPGSKWVPGVNEPLLSPTQRNLLPNYSNLKPGTKWTYKGVTYSLSTGAEGRLWGTDPSGKQVLITEPTSAYPTGYQYP